MVRKLILFGLLGLFFACGGQEAGKDSADDGASASSNGKTETPNNTHSQTPSDLEGKEPMQQYMYVSAPSGLNLREGDQESAVITKIPYATKVKMLEGSLDGNFTVENLEGRMEKLEYEGQEGFAFSGFLSIIPPPSGDTDPAKAESKYQLVRDYAAFLDGQGFKSLLEEPQTEEVRMQLYLPARFNGAFMIMKQLFFIPGEYSLPPKGEAINYSTPEKPSKAAQEGPYDYVTQTLSHGTDPEGRSTATYYDDSEVGGREINLVPEPDGEGMEITLKTWSH